MATPDPYAKEKLPQDWIRCKQCGRINLSGSARCSECNTELPESNPAVAMPGVFEGQFLKMVGIGIALVIGFILFCLYISHGVE